MNNTDSAGTGTRKIAVILLQLGGPDSLDAVKPYLSNFFSDPAIIGAPNPIRWLLSKWISSRRAPIAREIYRQLGGKSPILEQTKAQSRSLEGVLNSRAGPAEYRCFTVMRYWHPFAREVIENVQAWGPDDVVLLPLYPQFSTTTSESAINDWHRAAGQATWTTSAICCYPSTGGLIEAHADLIRALWPADTDPGPTRLLFTAHGLPVSIVEKGDPYAWQVERTAKAVVKALDIADLDWRVSFQSRVTPQKWLEPDTEDEIVAAGRAGIGLVMVPIAFVSEHSETLVELDIENEELAAKSNVPRYQRVPALATHPAFIDGLAELVQRAAGTGTTISEKGDRLCPCDFKRCLQPVGASRRVRP